jgi:hypothetical protein
MCHFTLNNLLESNLKIVQLEKKTCINIGCTDSDWQQFLQQVHFLLFTVPIIRQHHDTSSTVTCQLRV